MSHTDCDRPLYDCPMCGLICSDYRVLQEHVDLHLEESSFQQGMITCLKIKISSLNFYFLGHI